MSGLDWQKFIPGLIQALILKCFFERKMLLLCVVWIPLNMEELFTLETQTYCCYCGCINTHHLVYCEMWESINTVKLQYREYCYMAYIEAQSLRFAYLPCIYHTATMALSTYSNALHTKTKWQQSWWTSRLWSSKAILLERKRVPWMCHVFDTDYCLFIFYCDATKYLKKYAFNQMH